MTRVNFRDIRERFTHIDAVFVSCELGFDDVTPQYTVSFYPWWEHPAWAQAMNEGKDWGFDGCDEGYKNVTVYPKGLVSFCVSRRSEVINWDFHLQHPMLWPFEDTGQIFCNSAPPLGELVEKVVAALPNVPKAEIYAYLDPQLSYKPPFCLGTFPFTLFQAIEKALNDLHVKTFISRHPEPRDTPIMFQIGDADYVGSTDYIIADDFDVDVPDFEHRPEWFKSTPE